MRSVCLSRALALVVMIPASLWLGCGGGGADNTDPPIGALDVTVSTSGAEPDADGYAVSLDGGEPATLGANATRRTEGVTVGSHTVALSGIAANCAVTGRTSVTVEVA